MRPVSDAQVRKLMEEMSKHGALGRAAMKAGMDRKTARKYVAVGKMPSELVQPRGWRTREDPFAEDWPEVSVIAKTRGGSVKAAVSRSIPFTVHRRELGRWRDAGIDDAVAEISEDAGLQTHGAT